MAANKSFLVLDKSTNKSRNRNSSHSESSDSDHSSPATSRDSSPAANVFTDKIGSEGGYTNISSISGASKKGVFVFPTKVLTPEKRAQYCKEFGNGFLVLYFETLVVFPCLTVFNFHVFYLIVSSC